MNLSELVDPITLRDFCMRKVESRSDEAEELAARMDRLMPLAEVLLKVAFERYTTVEQIIIAKTAALSTLAIIDGCIESFTVPTAPKKGKNGKRKRSASRIN